MVEYSQTNVTKILHGKCEAHRPRGECGYDSTSGTIDINTIIVGATD